MRNNNKLTIKNQTPLKGRIFLCFGILALWLYYHGCKTYVRTLNSLAQEETSVYPSVKLLPSETAAFLIRPSRKRMFSADWLFFRHTNTCPIEPNRKNRSIYYYFTKTEELLLLPGNLFETENIKCDEYFTQYTQAVRGIFQNHTRRLYIFLYIGIALAIALLYCARKRYNIHFEVPNKYANKHSERQTNLIFLYLLIIQPFFYLNDLILLDDCGKEIAREINYFCSYLTEPSFLPNSLNKEHFYTYLPYAYALGLENQWASRCSLLFPEAGQELVSITKELKSLECRIETMERDAKKAKKFGHLL